jgi:endo-1,4-beta-mannosidase
MKYFCSIKKKTISFDFTSKFVNIKYILNNKKNLIIILNRIKFKGYIFNKIIKLKLKF